MMSDTPRADSLRAKMRDRTMDESILLDEIASLERDLAARDKRIAELQSDVNVHMRARERAERELALKPKHVRELNAEILRLQDVGLALERELAEALRDALIQIGERDALIDVADKMAEGIRRLVTSSSLDCSRSMAADAELIYRARRVAIDAAIAKEQRK